MLGQLDPGDGSILASTPDLDSMKRQINSALQRICAENDFPVLRHTAQIRVRPAVDTGTVTATTDSTALTGSGTAWDRTMEGQQITVDGELNRVRSVSSTTALVLENAVTGAGGAGLDYTIKYDFFKLPRDFMKNMISRQLDTPAEIRRANIQFENRDFLLFDQFSGILNRQDYDFNDTLADFYNTGTAVATQGSTTVDGTGTSWDDQDIEVPGASFRFTDFPDDEYKIASITDAVTIELDRPYRGTTVAVAKNYAIDAAGVRGIRFFDYPTFDGYVYIEYKRKPYWMVGDEDTPVPIPSEYHDTVLLKRALIDALQIRRLPYQDIEADYKASLAQMRNNINPNVSRVGSHIQRLGSGPFIQVGQIRTNQLTTN